MEGNVAALAARRATRAEIVNLKALLETARECVRKGVAAWEIFCEVDNAIHVAIAAASGNSVYGFVLRMVHGNIQKYYEAHPLKDQRIMQENYDDLCEIVQALEKKQATAVKSLVQGHVRRFNRYMLNDEC